MDGPELPKLHGMQLRVQHALQVAHFDQKTAGLQTIGSLDDLILMLPELMATPQSTPASDQQTPLQTTQNIYAEIADLKSDAYKIHLNEALTRIRFSKFNYLEQHHLEVELPSLRLLDHSLPDCVQWAELFSKCTTLTAMLQQFQRYLDELASFYENLGDIDEMCHVLQPLHPNTKDNFRLFLLRERVFIKITLTDPFSPVTSLKLNIIGPSKEVAELRRRYSEGLKDWDSELDIHKNLLRIFDLCFFPMPPGGSDAATDGPQFCNICYCYQLDDQVPLVSCDSQNCSLIFHAACLREWFNTLSDGKIFLDVNFGACPFCKAVSVASVDINLITCLLFILHF